jgi:hypothetical protein
MQRLAQLPAIPTLIRRHANSNSRSACHAREAVAIFALCGLAVCASASPVRYEDDLDRYIDGTAGDSPYDRLKYTRLSRDPHDFISFGADFRERAESADVSLLGRRDTHANSYLLQRLLLHADVRFGALRAFVQLGSEAQLNRASAALPTDVDHLDIAQAFVDYALPLGTALTRTTLRAGRFEMSFDEGALIGLRDGPNVRQDWDGSWAFVQTPAVRVDAFFVRPVAVKSGVFDDAPVAGQRLWGIHAASAAAGTPAINAFCYGSEMPQVAIWPLTSAETTQTCGIRGRLRSGGADASLAAIGQTGSFDGRDVRAWAMHADAGFDAPRLAGAPHFAAKLDVLSGGDNTGGVVRTFNALYPNYAFSTEATLEAPANLIQPSLNADLHPAPGVAVQYKAEGLWRYSTRDAFYAAPLFPLVAPSAHAGRFSGIEQQLFASWSPNSFVTASLAYVHFAPSAFLRSGHAVAENFGMAEISVRL